MMVATEHTPNPDTLKFLPEKKVSEVGPIEFLKNDKSIKVSFGVVTVELKGSCSECPSLIMTLKQGVQNLFCHYIPEVKSVEAI